MHVINPQICPHSDEHAYLRVASALLMTVGVFHLVFSVICMCMILFSPMMNFAGDGSLFSMLSFSGSELIQTLVYGYVMFLSFLGWAVGGLTIQAARYCLQTHSWHFIMKVVMLNWFWFPAGITVGLLVWRDLRRKGIKELFDDV